RRTGRLAGAAAPAAPGWVWYVVAGGAARAVFGGELKREQQIPVVRVVDPMAVSATPDGSACGFYAAGFTELLRLLVGFEGAMPHTACRSRGDARCEWRAAASDPRHH